MSERLPVSVDPFRLAETGRELRGSVPLARLGRLASLLASQEGEAHVTLRFGVDEVGVRYIRGQVEATLSLICQRCLQPAAMDVRSEVLLGLASNEVQAAQLPAPYEPLVVEAVPLALSEIIEDELLLALPLVAAHAEQECPVQGAVPREAVEPEQGGRDNPFAVLSKLKSKSDQ